MEGERLALGRLCVERGLITEEQLQRALHLQKEGRSWRRLGDILLSEGLITGVALAKLLGAQQAMRRGGPQPADPAIAPRVPVPAPPGTVPPSAASSAAPPPPRTELGWLLSEARASGASAIVLGAGHAPAFRACGTTALCEGGPLSHEQIESMLQDAAPPSILRQLDQEGFVDAIATLSTGDRIRFTLYRCGTSFGGTLRLVSSVGTDLQLLGLPPGVRDLAKLRSGLVLVTGPSGSGKTTTLTAILDAVNASRACHILTIERPIEIDLAPKRARLTRREVGRDSPSWAEALKASLRADADVIAVAELADAETITAALGAAESGHLVLGTMHTGNSYQTILRILDAFPARRAGFVRGLIASCLRGIVTQRLFASLGDGSPALAVELLLGTPGVANLIREDRAHQIPYIIQTSRAEGMVSLDESLQRLVKKGKIPASVAAAESGDPAHAAAARKEAGRVAH